MSLDLYPSTNDCAPELAFKDDGVLKCIIGARGRVERAHSTGQYIGYTGTCAVGAPFAELGVTEEESQRTRPLIGADWVRAVERLLDAELREEARGAMAVLNAAAIELVPESAGYGTWAGPLEWVNQCWYPGAVYDGRESFEDLEEDWQIMVRDKVLEIYDRAITMREVELQRREAEQAHEAQVEQELDELFRHEQQAILA